MPIYGYQCSACGHQKDALQKLSDPVLTTCPQCQEETFARQVSAPAFQLKGTGWYVTDFRDGKKPSESAGSSDSGDKSTKSSSDSSESKAGGETKSSGASAASSESSSSSTSKTESSATKSTGSSKPAPASGSTS